MKPDWKDAPEWAQWLAMDEDGEWVWFQKKPEASDDNGDGFWWAPVGEACYANVVGGGRWDETLEARP